MKSEEKDDAILYDIPGQIRWIITYSIVESCAKISASLYCAWFYNDVHIYRLHFSSSAPVSVKPIDIVYDQPQQTTQ